MATVTGLTADRMLAIEAASVVDGDVVGDDLFLAKHDGSVINAGNVRGPAGPVGPMAQDLVVVTAAQILEMGLPGQLRAGRQLSVSDFTSLGLSAPAGLWNLSNFNDSSGNGRGLTNKGSVPLGVGINGGASTAAVFAGSTAQALYVLDTGVADPLRLKFGSFGCWQRTAKKGVVQYSLAKWMGGSGAYGLRVESTNTAGIVLSPDGTTFPTAVGTTDVCDDRWHFVVAVFDGSYMRLYVDGAMEGSGAMAGTIFGNAGPLNIGSANADASTAASSQWYGRLDEAFVTPDILSSDQIRMLYCASIPHTLGKVPVRSSISIRRTRKGGVLAPADFPSAPARLHNFTNGSLADEGSNATALALTNTPIQIAGPAADGSRNNGFFFTSTSHNGLQATDAGLPAGLAARSYGCWFKVATNAVYGLVGWATAQQMWIQSNTTLYLRNNGDDIATQFSVIDSSWHQAIGVEDNSAGDGVKRKLYFDGKLVGTSTIMNAITLGGANRFRVGAFYDGTFPMAGAIDGVFVVPYALTADQVHALFAKGSMAMPPSQVDASQYVEAFDAVNVYGTFEALGSNDAVDLAVA
jgi:hypothetical protein